jgi:hypothetical protein
VEAAALTSNGGQWLVDGDRGVVANRVVCAKV